MERRNVIEVQDLIKRYNGTTAVDGISFTVKEGEIFSMVGPNGAGKTTTVEILEGLKTPTSGHSSVFEHDVNKEGHKIKEKIGVMPQDFNTFDRLKAKENIKLMADLYGNKNVEDIIEMVGIKEFEDKKFSDLSGGMKTKVGICMALVSDADLIFLDEPTTGLDPHARREIWKIIENLKKEGKTVFLTTHYMEEVEKLSDRVAMIIDGKIKIIDSVKNLIDEHGGGVKVIVDDHQKAIELIKENADEVFETKDGYITGIFDSKNEARSTISKLFQLDCEVEVKEAGMEDVFIRLTGGKIDEEGELVWRKYILYL